MDDYSKRAIDEVLNFNTKLRKKWEKERLPYTAFMELTPHCNYNCVHCYMQDQHSVQQLDLDRVIEIIDLLHQKGILFITFSGGEIFTRSDFLEIYLYAKKRGFFVELFTNGSLITPELVKCLAQYPPLLVDISLYGANEETYYKVTGRRGEFEKVIHNVKKLKENNIRVSLKTPIIKELADNVDQMRRLAEDLEVPYATSYEITRTIDGDAKTQQHRLNYEDMLRMEFEESIKNGKTNRHSEDDYKLTDDMFICNVASGSFVIDYQGNLCPCMKFRHRGVPLEKDSFDNIWKSFGEFRQIKVGDNNKCKNCKARYYCDFCPAEREFILGSMDSVDPTACAYAHARHAYYRNGFTIEQAISLFYKLSRKEGNQ